MIATIWRLSKKEMKISSQIHCRTMKHRTVHSIHTKANMRGSRKEREGSYEYQVDQQWINKRPMKHCTVHTHNQGKNERKKEREGRMGWLPRRSTADWWTLHHTRTKKQEKAGKEVMGTEDCQYRWCSKHCSPPSGWGKERLPSRWQDRPKGKTKKKGAQRKKRRGPAEGHLCICETGGCDCALPS